MRETSALLPAALPGGIAVFMTCFGIIRRVICAVAFTAAVAGSPVAAQQSSAFSPQEQAAVKALVLQTIREHPEIVVEALQAIQARTEAEAAAKAREAVQKRNTDLVSDPNAPVIGNPDGDVTVVEFFDYNCPYCKRAAPEVAQLIGQDTNLRLVMREWPILGSDSEYAARAALAARAQGKYKEYHDAMMRSPRANEVTVRRVAAEIGLDPERLADDMQDPLVAAHIEQSRRLAVDLGITGTPSFVIGETIVPGYVEHGELATIVAETRASLRE